MSAVSMASVATGVTVASVLVIYLARIAELRTKRETVAGPVREQTTLRLFVLAGTAMLVGSIVEQLRFQRPFNAGLFVAGWAFAGASFAIRRSAIRALGRFWSLHVEIRTQHELVKEGPFRLVRHPVYTSMIFELLAFALLLQSMYTAIGVLFVFVPTLVWRIVTEEQALVAKFGDAYEEYRRTTPSLVPAPWKRVRA